VIFFRILAVSGPTNAMLVTLLIPISGILFGITILGETLYWRHIAGALVIGSGLILIDGRLIGRAAPARTPAPSPTPAASARE
jgi:drug/metabolite transporter (DMT)-like permease